MIQPVAIRGLLLVSAAALALAGCGGGGGDNSAATTASPEKIAAQLHGRNVPGLGTISKAGCSQNGGQTKCIVLTDDGVGASCTVARGPGIAGLYCGRATKPAKTRPCSPTQEKRLEQAAGTHGKKTGCVTASFADKMPPTAQP